MIISRFYRQLFIFLLLGAIIIFNSILLFQHPSETTSSWVENFESRSERKMEMVISRYNETLEWISDPPFNDIPAIVYNKGPNREFKKSPNIEKIEDIPNVGREGHAYFYHIIQNYDNLADITIFLPGSVNLPHKYDKSKNVVNAAKTKNHSVMSCGMRDDTSDRSGEYDFKIDNYLSSDENNKKINADTSMEISKIRPFGKWFDATFTNGEKNTCIGRNAVFAISKQDILQKSKSYYESMMSQLSTHQNPETIHYFERSWYAVFYPYSNFEAV